MSGYCRAGTDAGRKHLPYVAPAYKLPKPPGRNRFVQT